MSIFSLKTLFDGALQYYLKVRPGTHVRVTRGDRWIFKSTDEYLQDYDKRKNTRSFSRKQQLVRANAHREQLMWTVKKDGFDLTAGCYIMVFMKHMPKTWKTGVRKPGKRDLMAWKPMECKPDVDNYVKKIFDSLLRDDKKIWCAAPMKIWVPDNVEEGTYFINVPELFEFTVRYLQEKLNGLF